MPLTPFPPASTFGSPCPKICASKNRLWAKLAILGGLGGCDAHSYGVSQRNSRFLHAPMDWLSPIHRLGRNDKIFFSVGRYVGACISERGNYGSFGLVWTFNFRTYLPAGALVF